MIVFRCYGVGAVIIVGPGYGVTDIDCQVLRQEILVICYCYLMGFSLIFRVPVDTIGIEMIVVGATGPGVAASDAKPDILFRLFVLSNLCRHSITPRTVLRSVDGSAIQCHCNRTQFRRQLAAVRRYYRIAVGVVGG